MASLTRSLSVFSDGSIGTGQGAIQTPPLFMHKEDVGIFGMIRMCAPCPAVWTLNEPNTKVKMTKSWQFYLRAMNYNMPLQHVAALLDFTKAFANGTGFGDSTDPRANWILGENLTAPLPQLDKDRDCSRNLVTGAKLGDRLTIRTLDGNNPPPLKPGRTHPQTMDQVDIDDYLYNPKDHPWLFVVANIVNTRGEVVPFPNGALYSWTNDNTPYTFFPLVSNEIIIDTLNNYIELVPGSPLPKPYRRL